MLKKMMDKLMNKITDNPSIRLVMMDFLKMPRPKPVSIGCDLPGGSNPEETEQTKEKVVNDMKAEAYVPEELFKELVKSQLVMTPKLIHQLRRCGVSEKKELKLQYFFYTNTTAKASKLAKELKALGYEVETIPSPGDEETICITGWTTKILMSENIVVSWDRQMCKLGYKHDCAFDGWGTYPEQ